MPSAKGSVTLRDVAAAAGVSLKTASNAANGRGRMSEQTRGRVEATIRELGYQANLSARSLSSGKTGVIALAVPTLKPPYLAELAERVIESAAERDYAAFVLTYGGHESPQSALFPLDTTLQRADGVLLSMSEHDTFGTDELKVDYPLVCLGSRLTFNQADRVTTDDVADAMVATEYIIDRGVQHVAVVGVRSEEDITTASSAVEGNGPLRLRGVLDGLAARQMSLDPRCVGVTGDSWTIGAGYEAMRRVIDGGEKFDGVVCFNDQLAIGVMSALREHDLKIPDDVQVIGFDNIEEAEFMAPPLTTMDSNIAFIADTALDRLITRIEDDQPVVETFKARSRVIERATTRKG